MARRTVPHSTQLILVGGFLAYLGVMFLVFRYQIYYAYPLMRNYGSTNNAGMDYVLLSVACFVLSLITCVFGFRSRVAERKALERVRSLSDGIGASPQEFMRARSALTRNGDFTGIYVIHNKTKDKYYVGQSVRVVGRVRQHLMGRGNGDVYADYKYGDKFEINLVSLRESGYDSLDALERDTIEAYGGYTKGYNRTRGNRN